MSLIRNALARAAGRKAALAAVNRRRSLGDDTSTPPNFAANMCDPSGPFYYQNNPAIAPSDYPQFAAKCQALGVGPTCPTPTPTCASQAGLSFYDVAVMNPSLPAGCQCTLPSGAAAMWNGTTLAPAAGGALSTADVAALQAAGWTSSQMGRSQPVSTIGNPFGTLVPGTATPGGPTLTGMLLIGGGILGIYLLSKDGKKTPVRSSKRGGA